MVTRRKIVELVIGHRARSKKGSMPTFDFFGATHSKLLLTLCCAVVCNFREMRPPPLVFKDLRRHLKFATFGKTCPLLQMMKVSICLS
jgi:hypothetical protein